MIASLLAALLAISAFPAPAQTNPSVEADEGVAVGRDVINSTINNIRGMPPEQVVALVASLNSPDPAAKDAALVLLRARLPAEAAAQAEAVAALLRVLGERDVPPDQLVARFEQLARDYQEALARLDALDPADPALRDLVRTARETLADGRFEEADALLTRVEEAEFAAAMEARRLADEAAAAADARLRAAATAREERARIAHLQLDYEAEADHYAAAADILPTSDVEARWRLQLSRASALYDHGREFGDNAALEEAVDLYRGTVLPLAPRDRVPLDWAATQNNLGTALRTLGARAAGTARLQAAVDAYRLALQEWTRDRVPLDWAGTQNNLGNALHTLGERETGTTRLLEAVHAYRLALQERTRDRVPLDWAATQNNLGTALHTLGERETGTTRLLEAVHAYRLALQELTRERVPLDWAATQLNLALALVTLGEKTGDVDMIEEAVEVHRAALLERTRDRVPIQWAHSRWGLAFSEMVLFDLTGDGAHLDRAEAHYEAAREVFVAAGADHFVGIMDRLLSQVRAKRP